MSEKVYQVSELNEAARDLLETGFSRISVEGEISNLSRPASGHLYFSLKDAQASIACALFKGSRFALRMDWTEIANGVQVRLQGRVSLYTPRGQYQLIAAQMEPAGLGALEREYQLRLQRLQAEGLFAAETKREPPRRAMRIGVITSPSGAAVHDVLNTLKRRNPAAQIVIYPCMVQGKEAPAQIIAALQAANRRQECEVLLLVRGGGSLEDLWAFNDEALARAVAASVLPVISGVGHEVDTTLADFAADRRAATPTAAAEMVSPPVADEVLRLQRRRQQLSQDLARLIRQQRFATQQLQARLLRQDPRRQVEQRQQRADELQGRLQQAMQRHLQQADWQQRHLAQRLALCHPDKRLGSERQRLGRWAQSLRAHQPVRRLESERRAAAEKERRLLAALRQRLQQERQQLQYRQERFERLQLASRVAAAQTQLRHLSLALQRRQENFQAQQQQQFAALAQRLALLNPLAVLARGYAVVENPQGEVLSRAQDVQLQEQISVRFADGEAQCRVEKVKLQS